MEFCVKCAKFHFKDIIMEVKLTYEEFLTVIIEVEAILSSRSLTNLSDNPNDMKALCPFDFLIHGNVSGLSD